MTTVYNILKLKERRVELRKSSTSEEKILWLYLRKEQLGFKFRRQHSIGGYIADFYCPEKKLVIELDGPQHYKKDNLEYDKIRSEFFAELGIKVIRYTNLEVVTDIEKVVRRITTSLRQSRSTPSLK